VTTDEVARHLQISHGSTHQVIHNRLGFHKVCARWFSKHSIEYTSTNTWVSASTFCITKKSEGENFLRCFVTGEETWLHYCDLKNK
jgi:hypothetical protein